MKCKCSHGGPMGMERHEHGCPIHDTNRYRKLDFILVYQMRDAENDLRRAVENGNDLASPIARIRHLLDQMEAVQ